MPESFFVWSNAKRKIENANSKMQNANCKFDFRSECKVQIQNSNRWKWR